MEVLDNFAKPTHIYQVKQWFSTFLLKRNPKETFQWLEELLRNNSIVLCKKTAFNVINKIKVCVTSGGILVENHYGRVSLGLLTHCSVTIKV